MVLRSVRSICDVEREKLVDGDLDMRWVITYFGMRDKSLEVFDQFISESLDSCYPWVSVVVALLRGRSVYR